MKLVLKPKPDAPKSGGQILDEVRRHLEMCDVTVVLEMAASPAVSAIGGIGTLDIELEEDRRGKCRRNG